MRNGEWKSLLQVLLCRITEHSSVEGLLSPPSSIIEHL